MTKRAKTLPAPRGNDIKEAVAVMDQERRYAFVPESITITPGELALILHFCGLTIPEAALVQLPVSTRRHFKLRE